MLDDILYREDCDTLVLKSGNSRMRAGSWVPLLVRTQEEDTRARASSAGRELKKARDGLLSRLNLGFTLHADQSANIPREKTKYLVQRGLLCYAVYVACSRLLCSAAVEVDVEGRV